MKKIHFNRGTAFQRVGLNKVDVESIDVQSCDECGFDFCDCAIIMKDLETGDKMVLFFLDGALSFSTYDDFQTFKESEDSDDLNATALAEV